MPLPKAKQLTLSTEAANRLKLTIENDFSKDSADLKGRNEKMKRYARLARAASDVQGIPQEERSNFSIPLILWQILAKLAKELDVLLGEESEISVTPIGESDVKRAKKVKKWMNWRIKVSLKLFKKLYPYLLQKSIMGTSIGFVPWVTKKRLVKKFVSNQVEGFEEQIVDGLPAQVPFKRPEVVEVIEEVIDFDGPDLVVEDLEDWVVPSTAKDIESADHFIRIVRLDIDEILDMSDSGKLDAGLVKANIDSLRRISENTFQATELNNDVFQEKKEQQGVPEVPQGRETRVTFYNWFGKFRTDDKDKLARSEEVIAFYQPELKKVLGVSLLVESFPDGRRPFIKSDAIMNVNQFWGTGLCELLEPISNEMDALHTLAVSAAEGAVGTVVFASPTAGINWDKVRIEPNTVIFTPNPQDIKVVPLGQINMGPYIQLMQELTSFAERLTALNDPQLGRQLSQPNAPRTLGQQQLLQAESNVRLLLDIRLERENLRELLKRIWELDKRFLPKPVFFRVTEEDPGDVMTEEEMQGSYDFDIGPITALSNRQQKSEELMQLLALSGQVGIPQVTMALFKRQVQKAGFHDVAALIPDASEQKQSEDPAKENIRLLQGEDVDPNPQDNHSRHIAVHQDLADRLQSDEAQALLKQNPGVLGRIAGHIDEHKQAVKRGGLGQGGFNVQQQQAQQPQLGLGGQQQQQPGQQSAGDPASQLSGLLNAGGGNLG